MLTTFPSTTHLTEQRFAIEDGQVLMKSFVSLRHCPFLTLHRRLW